MRYRYRTDEEMKDSGVEWIGKIPKEWDLKSLKFGIEDIIDNRGKTPPIEEIGIPLLEIDSLIGLNYNPSTDKISKFVSKETYDKFLRKYLKEGDILFATVGSIGRVAIVPKYFNYCIAQNIVGFRTNNKIYNKYNSENNFAKRNKASFEQRDYTGIDLTSLYANADVFV